MPGRGGSSHHMSLTGHREAYRRYCPCCENYRILHRHPTKEYYCNPCIKKINRALQKQGLDPQTIAQLPDTDAITPIVDQIIAEIRPTLPKEKTTEQDFRQKWRRLKKKPE